jgi:hypothetical protein
VSLKGFVAVVTVITLLAFVYAVLFSVGIMALRTVFLSILYPFSFYIMLLNILYHKGDYVLIAVLLFT